MKYPSVDELNIVVPYIMDESFIYLSHAFPPNFIMSRHEAISNYVEDGGINNQNQFYLNAPPIPTTLSPLRLLIFSTIAHSCQ